MVAFPLMPERSESSKAFSCHTVRSSPSSNHTRAGRKIKLSNQKILSDPLEGKIFIFRSPICIPKKANGKRQTVFARCELISPLTRSKNGSPKLFALANSHCNNEPRRQKLFGHNFLVKLIIEEGREREKPNGIIYESQQDVVVLAHTFRPGGSGGA